MECWFDLERHLDAEIIGLRVGVHEIGPVLKKIVTNSRTGKAGKLSTIVTFIRIHDYLSIDGATNAQWG